MKSRGGLLFLFFINFFFRAPFYFAPLSTIWTLGTGYWNPWWNTRTWKQRTVLVWLRHRHVIYNTSEWQIISWKPFLKPAAIKSARMVDDMLLMYFSCYDWHSICICIFFLSAIQLRELSWSCRIDVITNPSLNPVAVGLTSLSVMSAKLLLEEKGSHVGFLCRHTYVK